MVTKRRVPPVTRTFRPAKNYLRHWRIFRGFRSQDDLGKKAKLSRVTISRLESGMVPFTDRSLTSLTKVLECTVVDLLSVDPNRDLDIFEIYRKLPDAQRPAALAYLRGLLDAGK